MLVKEYARNLKVGDVMHRNGVRITVTGTDAEPKCVMVVYSHQGTFRYTREDEVWIESDDTPTPPVPTQLDKVNAQIGQVEAWLNLLSHGWEAGLSAASLLTLKVQLEMQVNELVNLMTGGHGA